MRAARNRVGPTPVTPRPCVVALLFTGVHVALGLATPQALVYDAFDTTSLEKTLWQLPTPLDRWSVIEQGDGHLTLYGNGKWRGVASTRQWLLAPDGGDAALEVTFKIRAGIHYAPDGQVPRIYDSRVGLVEWPPDGSGAGRYFGFLMTWPEFSDGGKYKVALGGEWVQTKELFTQSTTQHDHLRIILERRSGAGICRAEFSQGGNHWVELGRSNQLPREPVCVELASCWGALAVDAVHVSAVGPIIQQRAAPAPVPAVPLPLAGTPFVYAAFADQALRPAIDGRLDDRVWQESEAAALQVRLYVTQPPSQPTVAMTCYDAENLYVAFRCREDKMELLRLAHKDPSGPVWQDDCVEAFIQPDVAGRWVYYFHAVVNALGVGWDDYGRQAQWACAAGRHADGWTVEMAIPFAAMGAVPPRPGDCWGFNVTREERPHGETTSWAPVRGGFHEPERFGRLVFGQPAMRLRQLGLQPKRGAGLALTAHLETQGPLSRSAHLEIGLPDGRHLKTAISAPGPVELALPRDLPAGPLRMSVRLDMETGPQVKTVVRWLHPGTGRLAHALWPTEVYDDTLYVADGQLTPVWMLAACPQGGSEGYEAILELPQWLEMLDPPSREHHGNCPDIRALTRSEVTRGGNKYRRVVVQVASPPPATTIDKVELWQEPIVIWLKATAPEGAKLPLRGQIRTRLKRGRLLEPRRTTTVVLLAGERGRQPRRIPVYMWLHGPAVRRDAWPELLAHYRSLGVNGLQEGVSHPAFDLLARRYGIGTMRSFWWGWWAPHYAAAHPEDLALDAGGRPEVEGSLAAICPEVLLAEGSQAFEEVWTSTVGADKGLPVGWNWDLEGPSPWRVCFCRRCLEAFRSYAGADPALALTFDVVRGNADLSRRWVDFAAWQTERMVRRFAERLARERPGCGLYVNSGGPSPAHPTEGRFYWSAVLPHLAGGMFFRYCNSPLASRTTLQTDSEAWLRTVGHLGTPLWAMLSAGYMRLDAYNYYEPALVALQVLQHLVIGYRGIEFWSYRGFDGRFNNALAAATRLVAEFEPWLVDGERIDIPADAIEAPETALAVARRQGGKVALFVLNYDPARADVIRLQESALGLTRWHVAGSIGTVTTAPDRSIRVPPLGVVVLLGS